jgi:hypothetical protein
MRRVFVFALLLFAGCSKLLPTEPSSSKTGPVTESALVGEWSGNIAASPIGENWSPVVVIIDNSGGSLHGQAAPKSGRTRRLIIEQVGGGYLLSVDELLPGDDCRSLGFVLTAATYSNNRAVTLSGDLAGKCPNTIIGQAVRFTRQYLPPN